jgi:hypothetical protein
MLLTIELLGGLHRNSRHAVFAEDLAAFDNAPACGSERGIDQFSSGLRFVHGFVNA